MVLKLGTFLAFSLLLSKNLVNSNPLPSIQIPKELEWNKEYNLDEFRRSIKSLVLVKSQTDAHEIAKTKDVLAMYLKFGPAAMYRTAEIKSSEIVEVLESMYEVIESQIFSLSNDIEDLEEISNKIVAAKDIAEQMKQKAELMVVGEVKSAEDLLKLVESKSDEIPVDSDKTIKTKGELILHHLADGIEYSDMVIAILLDYFPELNKALDQIIEIIESTTSSTVIEINTISEKMGMIKAKLDHIKANVIDLCYLKKREWRDIFSLISQSKGDTNSRQSKKQRTLFPLSGIRTFLTTFQHYYTQLDQY